MLIDVSAGLAADSRSLYACLINSGSVLDNLLVMRQEAAREIENNDKEDVLEALLAEREALGSKT